MKIILLFIFFYYQILLATPISWGLNDLTHLLPLPKSDEVSLLLGPQSKEGKGELIPLEIYKRLPTIVPRISPEQLYQHAWKVIALRFDPCFNDLPAPGKCQAQIRMVWQPLFFKNYSSSTIDASIHTFYNLSPQEWLEFIQKYALIKQTKVRNNLGQEPLQISPTLLQMGYKSDYWQKLSHLILKFTGQKNLSRLTIMTVNPVGNLWVFAGYKVTDGFLTLLTIPGIDKKSQAVSSRTLGSIETAININPDPQDQNIYMQFLAGSSNAKKTWTPEQILAVGKTSLSLENPNFHNSATVSCASCHTTRSVNILLKKSFPNWDWKKISYTGNSNLKNTTAQFSLGESLRMLGYFGQTPIISDRVINETDVSIRQLSHSRYLH
jgi:hypothetical protein